MAGSGYNRQNRDTKLTLIADLDFPPSQDFHQKPTHYSILNRASKGIRHLRTYTVHFRRNRESKPASTSPPPGSPITKACPLLHLQGKSVYRISDSSSLQLIATPEPARSPPTLPLANATVLKRASYCIYKTDQYTESEATPHPYISSVKPPSNDSKPTSTSPPASITILKRA
ncbi:hypothetical protein E6O75_ATG05313 [Venturia nashicola]|uniref:Uncharacterized protein n=1 Tax=Venturia nashicola TaxID=86259 RepID=A0A4Z1P2L5_9PEZI|nr:hypothetical protein E6O75_ATG05313 [Venturia nashicola]